MQNNSACVLLLWLLPQLLLPPLQYANIEALVKELGIPSPFTPFTRSSFYTPDGLQVESPI